MALTENQNAPPPQAIWTNCVVWAKFELLCQEQNLYCWVKEHMDWLQQCCVYMVQREWCIELLRKKISHMWKWLEGNVHFTETHIRNDFRSCIQSLPTVFCSGGSSWCSKFFPFNIPLMMSFTQTYILITPFSVCNQTGKYKHSNVVGTIQCSSRGHSSVLSSLVPEQDIPVWFMTAHSLESSFMGILLSLGIYI